ncbi:MAG: bifunctional DNA primase/polymerase [Acidimicrobiales bacterium]|nr:bifunctional DNA primase/polymerase [Acidimicrobiales bacterium]
MTVPRRSIDPVDRQDWVRRYTERGLAVVVLYGIDPATGGCECHKGEACTSAGKHPRFSGWRQKASSNAHRIIALLDKHPNSNIGLATGRSFGVVIDLDPRHGSERSLRQLERVYGDLPATRTAVTGSGGEHRVFRWPESQWVGNSIPALDPYAGSKGGIDVRGDGGLIVVEPSVHVTGAVYRWMPGFDEPIADLPDRLRGRLAADDLLARPNSVTPYGWMALIDEAANVRGAAEGSRHDTLLRAANRIGQLVGGEEIDWASATSYLVEAALAQEAPLDPEEIEVTVDHGLRFGVQSPRTAPPAFTGREDALASLAVIGEVVRRLDWPDHAGKRHFEVLMAHTRIATRAGGPGRYWAAERTVAQEMGTDNRNRVRRAHEELQELGWLKVIAESQGGHGRTWRLKLPANLLHTHPVGTPALSLVSDGKGTQHLPVALGHDAFRDKRLVSGSELDRDMPVWWEYHRGLGKTRYRMLDALWMADGPVTRAALAKTLGVHRSTVGRNLDRLLDLELVTDVDGTLVLGDLSAERMAEVAVDVRTAGAALESRESNDWSSPVRRRDVTAYEAAKLVLPETEPAPRPPALIEAEADDAPAVESEPVPSGDPKPDAVHGHLGR